MSLSKVDISKVSYKAKINWFKERFTEVSEGRIDIKPAEAITSDDRISIFEDLEKKAIKLEKRIDSVSADMRIPIDKERQPDIAQSVFELDPGSNGEYITYKLYIELLNQRTAEADNINIVDMADSLTGDVAADSMIVQNLMISGMSNKANVTVGSVQKNSDLERYINRHLNNIISWNEHDPKIRQILDFSDSYMDMHPDASFFPWRIRKDVSWERTGSKNWKEFYTNFSDTFKEKGGELFSGVKDLFDDPSDVEPLEPSSETKGLTDRWIERSNDFLNKVNSLFDMDYGADLICCLVAWCGNLDTKTLKALRALAQLIQNGLFFDFKPLLNSTIDSINNIMRGLLTHQIVGLIDHIIQRLVDPIKRWLNNPDPRWKKIFICTPVDEFINKYIVAGIEWIENELYSLLGNWYKKLELEYINKSLKYELIKENTKLDKFIKIIDVVISAFDRGAICGTGSSPTGDEVQRLMDSYDIGPGKDYKYPEEENPTIYNSFIPEDPEVDEESASPVAVKKFETQKVSSGIGEGERKPNIDECLKKVAPDDVVKVTEWIEEIKAKS